MTTNYRGTEITVQIISTPHGQLYIATEPEPTNNAWQTLDEAANEQRRKIDERLKPASLPQICFILDPSQQAILYTMIAANAEDATEPAEYHRILLQIEEEMNANCGAEETQRYLDRALALNLA